MANLADRRWMNIDDPYLNYTGTWFVDSYDQPGPFRAVGSLSGQSAHGTTAEGTISFSFEGTDFNVRGQSNINPSTTNSTIRCTVDGAEAASDVVTAGNLNFYRLCFGTGLSESLHNVTVQINPGSNTTFMVDSVTFYSLGYPKIRGQFSQHSADESSFRYTGVSWRNPYDDTGGAGRETYQTGSKAIVPFFGESVELRGYLTPEMPRVAGSASYSIDGSPPTTITLSPWTSGFRGTGVNDTIWRHTIFRTGKVPPGEHTLEVINLGSTTTVPLTIDYFVIAHGDIDNPTKAPDRPSPGQIVTTGLPKPPTTTMPIESTTSSPRKVKLAPIVGGVVGGIAVFACIGVLIYFCLMRRRKSAKGEPPARLTYEEAAALNIRTRDWTVAATPYNAEPTAGATGSSPANLSPQFTPPLMVMTTSPTAPLRRLPPPLPPQQPLASMPPPFQEQAPELSPLLLARTPPARSPPPIPHGYSSDEQPLTASSASVSPSMSVQMGSATEGQYDRAALPRGVPTTTKAGYSPRLYKAN